MEEAQAMLFTPAAPPGTPSVPPQPSFLAEYVFFPFYDYIVQFYPRSWIPNKVTLFGVSCTFLSSLMLLLSMPPGTVFKPAHVEIRPASLVLPASDLESTPLYPSSIQPFSSIFTPTALLVLCGILNLVYCVADNTDGRLARRDHKTSVIGEYLDHGLDCVTSLLSAAMAFLVMGASVSNMAISQCQLGLVTVLCHTLHMEKNIFIWGNRIATVDEAMVFFGICMWIPLIWPATGTTTVPIALLQRFFSPEWVTYLTPLKVIDIVYVFYTATQLQTIVSMVCRNWRMLFRIQTLAVIVNGAVLLIMLQPHNAYVKAALPATDVPGYTLGRLTYPAIWIITFAFTTSIIVHVTIASRCAKLLYADPLPLAGVIFVWFTFLSCPVGAAILSVVLHVVQILLNIRRIQYRVGHKAAH